MDAMPKPSPTVGNGHEPNGRFARGNKAARGNPHARRVGEIRSRLLDAVTNEDLDAVVRTLVVKAVAGEQWAVRELLDRLIGDGRISEPDPTPPLSEILAEWAGTNPQGQ